VRESFRSHGIAYVWSELDRSALYLELLLIINSTAIELLDDDELVRELQGLERRRGASGRDRIDHRPGSHDDRANVIAGVAHLVGVKRRSRAGFGWHSRDGTRVTLSHKEYEERRQEERYRAEQAPTDDEVNELRAMMRLPGYAERLRKLSRSR
jgi:hypothetical protein